MFYVDYAMVCCSLNRTTLIISTLLGVIIKPNPYNNRALFHVEHDYACENT